MLFKNITILDKDQEIKEGMYVGVKDDTIDYVSENPPENFNGQLYNGNDKLLLPGIYNTHAHSPMTLMRGYGENLNLQDWLEQKIFPFESKLYSEAVYYATTLAFAESLRFGIVSTTDMYDFCEDMVRAALDSKVKMNVGRALTSFKDVDMRTMDSFKEAEYLYSNYNKAGNGKVIVDMSLHAEYTSNERLVRQLAEYTSEIGARMHVHVSETQREHEECMQRHNGKTPVEYFNDLGLFHSPTTAAHCVWVTENDISIIADKNVTVASCPVSNLKLACGICNTPKMLETGVNVTIGTDSVASNNSLNFLEEMKFFALVNKERQNDPTVVTPSQTIAAATLSGAKSQGRENCGSIDVGNKADLILLDISGPNWHPVHNLKNNLVYSSSGSDISLTMVDGEVLYKDGEYLTIDLEKTIYEVEKAKNKILGAL